MTITNWVLCSLTSHKAEYIQNHYTINWKCHIEDWNKASPEATGKYHNQVGGLHYQLPTVSILPLFHQSILVTTWGILYYQLT